MSTVIDFHVHVAPRAFVDWLVSVSSELGMPIYEDRSRGAVRIRDGRWLEFRPSLIDLNALIDAQDRAGVGLSVISPVPSFFLYREPPGVTAEVARHCNDAIVAWCEMRQDRVLGLGTVPLNEPQLAAQELDRIVNLGLRGVIVGTRCGDMLLSDPRLEPFWVAADRNHCIVFVHPLVTQPEERLARERLPNILQVPWETTLAVADLMVKGIIYRYPNARILLAHGGGYLPYQIGRFERGYQVWSAIRETLPEPPREILRRMWFDTVLWRPEAVKLLVDIVGEERVVPGSDYPFDLSVWPPITDGARGAPSLLGQ